MYLYLTGIFVLSEWEILSTDMVVFSILEMSNLFLEVFERVYCSNSREDLWIDVAMKFVEYIFPQVLNRLVWSLENQLYSSKQS